MCGHCGCGQAAHATILHLQTWQKSVLATDPVEPLRHGRQVRHEAQGFPPVHRHQGGSPTKNWRLKAITGTPMELSTGTQQDDQELHHRSNVIELEARTLPSAVAASPLRHRGRSGLCQRWGGYPGGRVRRSFKSTPARAVTLKQI
jgi:hypothetical protein